MIKYIIDFVNSYNTKFRKVDRNIMDKAKIEYAIWKEQILPDDLALELKECENDEEQIHDRFCKDMTFGTSGLRGKMGVGSNRMNSVVIRRATMGIADYLLTKYQVPVVVIGYDTRINSKEYALGVAEELSKRGVETRVFKEPTPVPVLSFAIRHLEAAGGIMITASHNPKEYNGYKVYDHFGNQIEDKKARLMEKYIEKHSYFEEKPVIKDAPIVIMGDEVKNAYLTALKAQTLLWTDEYETSEALAKLSVVYTPLNGAGRDYVTNVFDYLGVGQVYPVEEQWQWDGSFPTCPSPNPEYDKTFERALNYAKEADVIIATDPDCDRMGIMAVSNGTMKRLTGNQVGELMLDYICNCHSKGIGGKTLGSEKIAYKSYVSSPVAEDIANHYGIKLKNVPTGFKNIAFEMEKLKETGHEEDFLFGFEESLGYLYGNYTRDKDGVLAAQMVCLMTAYLKSQGKTLFDRLEEIYQMLGYTESENLSMYYESEKERYKMDNLMKDLFAGRLETLMGEKLIADLSHQGINMYKATLPGGHQIIVRPSGTELKIKTYSFAKGATREEAQSNLKVLTEELMAFVGKYK